MHTVRSTSRLASRSDAKRRECPNAGVHLITRCWVRRRRIRTRLFVRDWVTVFAASPQVRSLEAASSRRGTNDACLFKTTLRRAEFTRCLLACSPQSRSEVSRRHFLGHGQSDTRIGAWTCVQALCVSSAQPRRRWHLGSALIHDKPGRSLPLNARPGGWRTSGESVRGMAGREQVGAREIGFTGGNIDWAQKLSGWTEGRKLFGTRVPSSQLPVSLGPLDWNTTARSVFGQINLHTYVVYVDCSHVDW